MKRAIPNNSRLLKVFPELAFIDDPAERAALWYTTFKGLCHQLLARGIPICLTCGYNLRGQLEPRCPKCGTAFDPSLIAPIENHDRPT